MNNGASSDRPLVSVITPCFNYGHFIGQTLESLQAQTLAMWECLVVDDGSTDDTREVVESYQKKDARLAYLHQEHRGPAVARNAAIQKSRGKYLQFLDADDLIEKRKLERHVDYLERHPEVDIVYGDMRYFTAQSADGKDLALWKDESRCKQLSGSGRDLVLPLVHDNIMVINSFLIRRSAVEAVGLFDESLRAMEDWDYLLRCAMAGKRFQYRDEAGTLALVRTHPSSLSHNKKKIYNAILQMRHNLDLIATDAEILRLNRELAFDAEAGLAIEEGRSESVWKGMRRLCRVAAASRNMKWFLYAIALPVAVQPGLKPFVARVKAAIFKRR